MKKIQEKIQLIETKIHESKIQKEKELLIVEMKKIGIEELPYSYSALSKFIDSETMNFHYNKHYKGYVDKLNDALKKRKGDLDLENIIKNISKYNETIRNNAGGAFNHALFWNMLTPTPKRLTGELYKKIISQYETFNNFKKKFETIAKSKFGSGWVWLVLTSKNTLKIMATSNQDNPLMNVIEGGGFPLLGLDLWEHAYYLKYKNKRDEYISNFWKVVNWEFVQKLYDMKTETKLLESVEFQTLLKEAAEPRFCSYNEVSFYRDLVNNSKIKKRYENGVQEILKDVFSQFWVEGNEEEMSGFYGIESPQGRSILNNLNTNYNAFCLLVKAVNNQIEKIKRPDKKFDFSKKEKRNIEEVGRFIKALDFFKKDIFTKKNPDFINIIKVLLKLWERGEKSENNAIKKMQEFFLGQAEVKKISSHGGVADALKGIDVSIDLNGTIYTAQVKPYSHIVRVDDIIEVMDTGNVKTYNVDWLIFSNQKTDKTLIFKNDPLSVKGKYIFKSESLIYEIE